MFRRTVVHCTVIASLGIRDCGADLDYVQFIGADPPIQYLLLAIIPALVGGCADTGPSQPVTTSSVQTLKLTSVLGPNVVAMATSIASRPLAIRTRPIRGTLLRGSNVYQRPPR